MRNRPLQDLSYIKVISRLKIVRLHTMVAHGRPSGKSPDDAHRYFSFSFRLHAGQMGYFVCATDSLFAYVSRRRPILH